MQGDSSKCGKWPFDVVSMMWFRFRWTPGPNELLAYSILAVFHYQTARLCNVTGSGKSRRKWKMIKQQKLA